MPVGGQGLLEQIGALLATREGWNRGREGRMGMEQDILKWGRSGRRWIRLRIQVGFGSSNPSCDITGVNPSSPIEAI